MTEPLTDDGLRRLSGDGKNRVLVLEAGRESHPWSRIPIGFARLIENSAANWLYSSEPDEGTGERWEAGQVWAHLAEFPGFWLDQIRAILAARAGGAGPDQPEAPKDRTDDQKK